MKYLILKISLIITGLVLLLTIYNKSRKKVGGHCEYMISVGEYKIDQIEMKNDTNYSIRFINTMMPKITQELTQDFINRFIPNFSNEIIQDTNQVYIITADVISSGTCTPEIVTGIKLKN